MAFVQGTIKDAVTGEPLAGAVVAEYAPGQNVNHSVVSDSAGAFMIDVPVTSGLYVTHVEYSPFLIQRILSSMTVKIALEPNVKELPGVTIVGKKTNWLLYGLAAIVLYFSFKKK